MLLLELPVPIEDVPNDWREAASAVQFAENEFRTGNYRGCIASCRLAMDELGRHRNIKWSKALGPLAQDGEGMNKAQREEALYSVLRHYTHPAHHAGAPEYTRSEAQFVLCATVAAIAHARSG